MIRAVTKRRLIIFSCVGVLALTALILALTLSRRDEGYVYGEINMMWENERVSPADLDMPLSIVSGGQAVDAADSNGYGQNVLLLETGKSLELEANISVAGCYNLYIDYYILHNGYNDSELCVYINGEAVLDRAPLKAFWVNEGDAFPVDALGNDAVPLQNKMPEWQSARLYRFDYSTAMAVMLEFDAGVNPVRLELISGGSVLIGAVKAVSAQRLISYEQYSAQYQNISGGQGRGIIEAERTLYKNDTSVIPFNTGDINCTPYDTYKKRLNIISNFDMSSQTLYYELDVSKTGMYELAFNYKVPNPNRTTYATIEIDGQVPFGELLHYPFADNGEFTMHTLYNGESNYKIYLTQGKHTLSVKIDSSLFYDVSDQLNGLIIRLTEIYLDLKKLAGAAQDPNREWNPDTDYPGITEELTLISERILNLSYDVKRLNARSANFESVIFLQAANKNLNGLLKDPQKLANNYQKLAESGGSVMQSLSNALSFIEYMPLELDKIVVYPAGGSTGIKHHGGFKIFWEGVKKFFYSFTADYSMESSSGKVLDVWVFRSNQYIDAMQQLVDTSGFEQKTGYKVRFTRLAEEGKLILHNAANISPNAVLGISNFLPYELGIRGITYDITKFPDYPDVISQFTTGAMVPLIADGRGLGLPETQDFYVMYYRKDILDRYGLDLPSTWEDVIKMLPALQRYGLNFYIPLSGATASKSIMTTSPFIYQHGGALFNDDGTATVIDSEAGINAVKMMTELYTLYGLPQQITNFYYSFRNGSLPIGVSNFETYLRLKRAAPEIAGKWDIALSPGIENKNGEIERWQTSGATSAVMMDSGSTAERNATWELLKWWMSEDVQTEFANRMYSLYGKSYVWNSANLAAFNNSNIFSSAEKKIITEQWEWTNEMPKVPGWYILERELSNAWNNIVINGQNTRSVIESAVIRIDKEIERKLTEFGYMENGRLIKPYQVTTLQTVEEIKKKAGR